MKRTPKETTTASRRRAIWRRLDDEDHSSRLREFMTSRGVPVPQPNVEAHPGASCSTSSSRSMAHVSVENDAIQYHPYIEVRLILLYSPNSYYPICRQILVTLATMMRVLLTHPIHLENRMD